MKSLQDWLLREVPESKPRADLQTALLDGNVFFYFFSRVRWLFALTLMQVVFHLLRYAFIYWKFPIFDFSRFFYYLQALFLIEAFVWGWLDHRRNPEADGPANFGLRREIQWILGAGGVALMAWIALTVRELFFQHRIFNLFDLLFLIEGARLVFNLLYMTAQAPLQSRGRISTPMRWQLGFEIFSLAVLIGLYPVIGPWSIPASALAHLGIREGVRWNFLVKRLRQARIGLRDLLRNKRPAAGEGRWVQLQHALGAVAIRFDHVILMLLFSSLAHAGGRSREGYLLQVATPLFKFAGEWSRILTFDLRRSAGEFRRWVLFLSLKSAHEFGLVIGSLLFCASLPLFPDQMSWIIGLTILRAPLTLQLNLFYLWDDFLLVATALIPFLLLAWVKPILCLTAVAVWIALAFWRMRSIFRDELDRPHRKFKEAGAVWEVSVATGIRVGGWLQVWREKWKGLESTGNWVAPKRLALFFENAPHEGELRRFIATNFAGTFTELRPRTETKNELPIIDLSWRIGDAAPAAVQALPLDVKRQLLRTAFESAFLHHPVKSSVKLPYRLRAQALKSMWNVQLQLKKK